MRYNPIDQPIDPKQLARAAMEVKLVTRLFAAEVVVTGFLFVTHDAVDALGAGGLIFFLPLAAAYMFVPTAVFAIPIIAFGAIKSRGVHGFKNTSIVYLAAIVNALAAIPLTIGIAQIFLSAP
jgi:hypothetical protein